MNRRNFITALGLGITGLATSKLIGKEILNSPNIELSMPFYRRYQFAVNRDELGEISRDELGRINYAFPALIIEAEVTEVLIPTVYDNSNLEKLLNDCIRTLRGNSKDTIYAIICNGKIPDGRMAYGVMASRYPIITPEHKDYQKWLNTKEN